MVLGRLCASNLNPYLKKFYLTLCQFRPMTVCTRPFQRCVCNGTCRWDPRPIHVLLPRAAFMYAQYSFCIAPFFYPFQDSNFGPPYLPSPTYLPSRHLHRVRLITGNKPSTWFDHWVAAPHRKTVVKGWRFWENVSTATTLEPHHRCIATPPAVPRLANDRSHFSLSVWSVPEPRRCLTSQGIRQKLAEL